MNVDASEFCLSNYAYCENRNKIIFGYDIKSNNKLEIRIDTHRNKIMYCVHNEIESIGYVDSTQYTNFLKKNYTLCHKDIIKKYNNTRTFTARNGLLIICYLCDTCDDHIKNMSNVIHTYKCSYCPNLLWTTDILALMVQFSTLSHILICELCINVYNNEFGSLYCYRCKNISYGCNQCFRRPKSIPLNHQLNCKSCKTYNVRKLYDMKQIHDNTKNSYMSSTGYYDRYKCVNNCIDCECEILVTIILCIGEKLNTDLIKLFIKIFKKINSLIHIVYCPSIEYRKYIDMLSKKID
jgi:hypothetical protein